MTSTASESGQAAAPPGPSPSRRRRRARRSPSAPIQTTAGSASQAGRSAASAGGMGGAARASAAMPASQPSGAKAIAACPSASRAKVESAQAPFSAAPMPKSRPPATAIASNGRGSSGAAWPAAAASARKLVVQSEAFRKDHRICARRVVSISATARTVHSPPRCAAAPSSAATASATARPAVIAGLRDGRPGEAVRAPCRAMASAWRRLPFAGEYGRPGGQEHPGRNAAPRIVSRGDPPTGEARRPRRSAGLRRDGVVPAARDTCVMWSGGTGRATAADPRILRRATTPRPIRPGHDRAAGACARRDVSGRGAGVTRVVWPAPRTLR